MNTRQMTSRVLTIKYIALIFIVVIQVSALLLNSINSYRILVYVMTGMKYAIAAAIVYLIYNIYKGKHMLSLYVCIECAGAILSILLYRDYLDRIIADMVPHKFVMFPYIWGCLIAAGIRILIKRGRLRNIDWWKITKTGIRRLALLAFIIFVVIAVYLAFWLQSYLLSVWSLLTSGLLFFVFIKLRENNGHQ